MQRIMNLLQQVIGNTILRNRKLIILYNRISLFHNRIIRSLHRFRIILQKKV